MPASHHNCRARGSQLPPPYHISSAKTEKLPTHTVSWFTRYKLTRFQSRQIFRNFHFRRRQAFCLVISFSALIIWGADLDLPDIADPTWYQRPPRPTVFQISLSWPTHSIWEDDGRDISRIANVSSPFASSFNNHLKKRSKPSIGYFDTSILDSSDVDENTGRPLFTIVVDEKDADEQCEYMHDWQYTKRSTCNLLHELNLFSPKLLGHGGARDVWSYSDNDDTLILKTLRYERHFKHNYLYDVDSEVKAMESLSSRNSIIDIYGNCAYGVLNEFANGGDLDHWLQHFLFPTKTIRQEWKNEVKRRKNKKSTYVPSVTEVLAFQKREKDSVKLLHIAWEVAHSVAEVQNVGVGENGATTAALVHRDAGPANFVFVDGKLKLNDFNACTFLKRNRETGQSCGFQLGYVCGEDKRSPDIRAPEECFLNSNLTEAIDTYAIGAILFFILSNIRPYHVEIPALSNEEMKDKIRAGVGPILPAEAENSSDPAIVAIKEALRLAMTFDPKERVHAQEVSDMLEEALKKEKETIDQ